MINSKFSEAIRNRKTAKSSGGTPSPTRRIRTDKIVYGVSSSHPHVKRAPLKYVPVVATALAPGEIKPLVKPFVSVDAKDLLVPKKKVVVGSPQVEKKDAK